MRDNDKTKYQSKDVSKAVSNVNTIIANRLLGKEVFLQSDVDALMISLDGTPNKSKLGANGILAVSIAFAKASALLNRILLYRQFRDEPSMIFISKGSIYFF